MTDDAELLRRYAVEKSQEAFAELVGRHIDFVYAAALRQARGNGALAQDVAQAVFTDLARKAAGLARHAVLVGWLHTATRYATAKAIRAEQRWQAREREAQAMRAAGEDDGAAVDWERLQPVLDDVLGELKERERVAILLRFFEQRPLAEVGARLALSETAARSCVDRALEKLRDRLARRGITSTGAALGMVLASQTGVAAPAGLAAAVIGVALAGAAGAGAAGLLTFMSMTKMILSVVSAMALAGSAAAVYQTAKLHRSEVALAAATAEQESLRAKLQAAEERATGAARRAEAADADNAALVKAVEKVHASAVAEAQSPVTEATVRARFQRARDLARKGNWEAALPELLWCYDEGMVRFATFAGVRASFLLSEIGRIAKHYPPALAALRERRDRAEARMLADASDQSAGMEVASLNAALGEPARNLMLFDQLPTGDARREGLLVKVYDQLIADHRYADAVGARPFSRMQSQLALATQERPLPAGIADPEGVRSANRRYVITTTVKDIEVLAGAGDVPRARELAQKLVAYDGTAETRRLINERAARAGQPALLAGP